jgi:hypothetical protein
MSDEEKNGEQIGDGFGKPVSPAIACMDEVRAVARARRGQLFALRVNEITGEQMQ